MHNYIIKVEVEINYWWDKQYRITASSAATAIGRALREIRKEERLKGKRIKRYRVDLTQLN